MSRFSCSGRSLVPPSVLSTRRVARLFFFFNDTATTEIYTLSLHDALPISLVGARREQRRLVDEIGEVRARKAGRAARDRSEEHTSELQSPCNLVCRLLLEKKKNTWQPSVLMYMLHVVSYCCLLQVSMSAAV